MKTAVSIPDEIYHSGRKLVGGASKDSVTNVSQIITIDKY